MTKSNQAYLILAIVAVSIVGYLFIFKKSTSAPKEIPQAVVQPSDPKLTDSQATEYIPFTTKDFEKNKSKRRVLFFYAGWCTTCRPVNAQFLESANQLPDDVVVFRVNFRDSDTDEEEKKLAEMYKITYQHTFVQVNEQGGVIKKWNGGNLTDLIKNVN